MHQRNLDQLVESLTHLVVTFVVVTLCVGVPLAAAGVEVVECLDASGATTAFLARAWCWLKKNP